MNTTPLLDSPPFAILATADRSDTAINEETPVILITVCHNRIEHIWVGPGSAAGGMALVVPLEQVAKPPWWDACDRQEGDPDGYQTVKIHRLRDETRTALLSLVGLQE